MKERLKAIAPKVGFPIFYLFCLVLFARWTFPYDKLRDRVVASFNEQQRETGGQQELKIDELGPSLFAGITAHGVRLLSPAAEAGKPPSEIKIDYARANVSLLGLLFGDTDVGFKVEAFGGTVDGSFDRSSKEESLDVTLDSVALAQIGAIADMLGVPADGTLDGTIKLTLPESKASKATGAVSLEAKDLSVGDGKAKIKGLLALPKITVGTLTIAGDAKDGILKVTKISAGGKDLDLQGDGRIALRDNLGESNSDLNIRFKISDAYRAKSETTKNLFGAPGSTIPGVIDMDPRVKQSKRADGFYGWHMRGPLARPDFDPAPFAPGGALPSPGGTPPMPHPGGG